MGRKPILDQPANRVISFRITDREFASWTRLAEIRDKPMKTVIRDGMNLIVSKTCLCKPGSFICDVCKTQQIPPPPP